MTPSHSFLNSLLCPTWAPTHPCVSLLTTAVTRRSAVLQADPAHVCLNDLCPCSPVTGLRSPRCPELPHHFLQLFYERGLPRPPFLRQHSCPHRHHSRSPSLLYGFFIRPVNTGRLVNVHSLVSLSKDNTPGRESRLNSCFNNGMNNLFFFFRSQFQKHKV